MIKKVIFLFLTLLSSFSLAQSTSQNVVQNTVTQNIQGILTAENESGILTVKEGDSFIGDFVIWPISYVDQGEFAKKFTNKAFLDYFHVTEVLEEGYSENNPDAYKVRLRLVLVKFFDNRNFSIWPFRGLNIPVSIKNINPAALEGRNKELMLIEQDYSFSSNKGLYLILFIIILFVSISIKVIPSFLKKKKIERELLEFKNLWNSKFQNASERKDYEFIYSSREIWLKCVPMQTPQVLEFFEVINSHQYKKEWSIEEFEEVSNSFKNIKDIIN